LPRSAAELVVDVHRASTAWTSALIRVGVEELDGVFSSFAGEVAVAVDHRETGAHVSRKVEVH
jgi:hypothetical protein